MQAKQLIIKSYITHLTKNLDKNLTNIIPIGIMQIPR